MATTRHRLRHGRSHRRGYRGQSPQGTTLHLPRSRIPPQGWGTDDVLRHHRQFGMGRSTHLLTPPTPDDTTSGTSGTVACTTGTPGPISRVSTSGAMTLAMQGFGSGTRQPIEDNQRAHQMGPPELAETEGRLSLR